jgi:hypothetical protein
MTHRHRKLHHHRHRGAKERELDVGGSTCIEAAYYDRIDKVLTVEFVKGGTYQFAGVTRGEAKDVEIGGGEALNAEIL